jgi:hypothetical protein
MQQATIWMHRSHSTVNICQACKNSAEALANGNKLTKAWHPGGWGSGMGWPQPSTTAQQPSVSNNSYQNMQSQVELPALHCLLLNVQTGVHQLQSATWILHAATHLQPLFRITGVSARHGLVGTFALPHNFVCCYSVAVFCSLPTPEPLQVSRLCAANTTAACISRLVTSDSGSTGLGK